MQTQVVDAAENVIRTYLVGTLSPGSPASVSWDLKDNSGNKVPQGVYCFQVVAAGATIKSQYFSVYDKSYFGAGNGSEAAPYEISTLDQLMEVRKHNGVHFKQVADIDLNSNAFQSLFARDEPFTGTYDGGNHVIRNISSMMSDTENIGIFTAIGAKGTVKNVVIDECMFNGKANIAAITGINEGSIHNCVVKNSYFVASSGRAGAIAGENYGSIRDCSIEKNGISATSSMAGGICGYNKGTVTECSSKSDQVAIIQKGYNYLYTGGMVGYNEGNILKCDVTSATLNGSGSWIHGGGIAGYNSGAVAGCNVSDLTFAGEWQKSEWKGGVIGTNKGISNENVYDGTLNYIGES